MRHVVFLTGLLAAVGPFLVGAQTQSGGDEPDVSPTIGTVKLEPSFVEWLRQQRKLKKVDVPPNLPALNSFTTVTTTGSGSPASTATRVILPKRDAQVTAAPTIGADKTRLALKEWFRTQTKKTISVEVARMKSLSKFKLLTAANATTAPTSTSSGSGSGSGFSAETPTASTTTTATRVNLPKRDAQVTVSTTFGAEPTKWGPKGWWDLQTRRTMSVEVAKMKSFAKLKLPTPVVVTTAPASSTGSGSSAETPTAETPTASAAPTSTGSGSGSSAKTPTAETPTASTAATSTGAPVQERAAGKGAGLLFFKCRSKKCENLCGSCDRHLKYLSREEEKAREEKLREQKAHEERLREVKLREEQLRKQTLPKETIQKRETPGQEAVSNEAPGHWRGKKCRQKWGPTKPCATTPTTPKKPKWPQKPMTTTTTTTSAATSSSSSATSSSSSASASASTSDYTPTYILNPYPTMPAAGLGSDPEVPPRPTEPVIKRSQAEPQLTRDNELRPIIPTLPRPILDVPPVPVTPQDSSCEPPAHKFLTLDDLPLPTHPLPDYYPNRDRPLHCIPSRPHMLLPGRHDDREGPVPGFRPAFGQTSADTQK
ncbi:hypothetical protein CGRA01v4_08905 [Colletotrichum graminicola]|uniref:Uncharacterized protein n=1 Tax=Colletotrichum graminicola (strain M1.001 / M2 / FGSC 10212) TaxID=645133 RepID=E3Q7I3_COLGM|nr:uncharacterized protein GLRG_02641 [Colletotrichum graminicola M1.001]EFQ26821.1 hypothetical protein GLRG_02641 [Colletotrichum graminicola M1.001]WDK17622.1 hypothetical protein CGRA01v4_08905 [Colletotrichum graminicola]